MRFAFLATLLALAAASVEIFDAASFDSAVASGETAFVKFYAP